MCITLTEVYYEHLCRPGGHAPTLAAAVLNDERVQAIRVPTKMRGDRVIQDREIRLAIVKGEETPPEDADLVAWSRE